MKQHKPLRKLFTRVGGALTSVSASQLTAVPLLLLLVGLLGACTHRQTGGQSGGLAPERAHPSPGLESIGAAPLPKTPQAVREPRLVWEEIREGLQLRQQAGHANVKPRIRWFSEHAEFLEKSSARAAPYLAYIVDEVKKRGMPMEVALLPFIESGFQPYARSPMRAAGIWQFIPSTGKIYGLRQDYWYDGRHDIQAATRAALDYLQKIHGELEQDWLLAFAAYNSGERRIARYVRRHRQQGKEVSFWALRKYLPRETRSYVPSLLAVASIINDPKAHGVRLAAVTNQTHFESVLLPGQFDLAYAAELADLKVEEIYTLNPGFKRWSTAPQGPHHLLLPADKAGDFRLKLAALSSDGHTGWREYEVRHGDSLRELAALHGQDAHVLAKINGLRGTSLVPGSRIRIPAPKYSAKRYASALYDRYSGPRVAGWEKDGIRHVHIVRRGDSLWKIARRYGANLARLRLWNPNVRGNLLRPGQRLVVWRPAQAPAPKAEAVVARTRVAPADGDVFHVVRRGESLWRIARRHRISMSQLRVLNDLPTGNRIYAGQRLRLRSVAGAPDAFREAKSIDYVVRKGDSLWQIARLFKTSVRELLAWNSLSSGGRHLRPGQTIKIYSPTH